MKIKLVSLVIFLALFLVLPTIASADVSGGIRIGHGRFLPSMAALVGLIGVVIGWRSLRRNVRAGAIVAMVVGPIVILIGALHAAYSAGGFGTGNGLAGAIVAMFMGLISIVLGGVALARFRAE